MNRRVFEHKQGISKEPRDHDRLKEYALSSTFSVMPASHVIQFYLEQYHINAKQLTSKPTKRKLKFIEHHHVSALLRKTRTICYSFALTENAEEKSTYCYEFVNNYFRDMYSVPFRDY